MDELLKLDGLCKSFGPIRAVDDVSIIVRAGEVLGFLGPNGAGKSTTMKMAAGFLVPDAGRAVICGHDVASDARAARHSLGYLPEGAPAYGEMTPTSFLKFCAAVRGLSGSGANRAVDSAIERAGLAQARMQTIDTLSKGYKRRVGIAQAILHDPPVLILDEPTDGLDPNQKHEVRRLIAALKPGRAIVISTHILEEVDAVCTRAVIIDRGRLVADGTSEELRRLVPERSDASLDEVFRYVTRPEGSAVHV